MQTSSRIVSACALSLRLLFHPVESAKAETGFYLDTPQAPGIPERRFVLTDFGGSGDGKTMNTAAFAHAIDACRKAGGGTVVVPAGTFVTGPIRLASHMALVLEKGSVVQASATLSDFGQPDPLPKTQTEYDALKVKPLPLISGSKLTDIAIRGEGRIDGAGVVWWARSPKAPAWAVKEGAATGTEVLVNRANMLVLTDCERIHVRGVTFSNPSKFHFVPQRCKELLVEDVTLRAPLDSPNTDAIDPSNCRNVLIRRCLIDTGDDNIAIKSGGGGPRSENITVRDCTLREGHGISIGSETDAGVANFLVENCSFEGTDNGLRIKSDRTRGGLIEHVAYHDIRMTDVDRPIQIFMYYDDKKKAASPKYQDRTATTPTLRDISFTDITCDGAKVAGEIIALPESPALDVRLENVTITGAKSPFVFQDAAGIQTRNLSVSSVPLKRPDAPEALDLWENKQPNPVPGAMPGADDGTGRMRDVGIPGMLVYLPRQEAPKAGRIALIVCPGGGYSHLTRLQGADGAVKAFAPENVAVMALKYRTAPPSAAVEADALADAKRAVRLVRHRAQKWGVDPHKIGVLGWSAGANLCLNLASHHDAGNPNAEDAVERESSRPDFVVLLSPWPSQPPRPITDFPISGTAPPAFIASARDDTTAPVGFAEEIAAAYQQAGAEHRLWVVAKGGHGAFTIDAPGEGGKWINHLWPWLEEIGVRHSGAE